LARALTHRKKQKARIKQNDKKMGGLFPPRWGDVLALLRYKKKRKSGASNIP